MNRIFLAAALCAAMLPRQYARAEFVFVDLGPGNELNQLPDGWNSFTNTVARDNEIVPLDYTTGVSSGLSIQYRSDRRSISGHNVALRPPQTPSGIDLSGFDYSLTIRNPGTEIELSGFTPGDDYNFWLLGWTYPADFREPMKLSVQGIDGVSEIAPPANVNVSINGQIGSRAQDFSSYAIPFTASSESIVLEAVSGEFFGLYGMVIESNAAAPTVGPERDQHHVISNSVGGLILGDDLVMAQSFTPAIDGDLTSVSMELGRDADLPPGEFSFRVVGMNAGIPNLNNVLVEKTIAFESLPITGPGVALSPTTVDLSDENVRVQKDETLAIVLEGSGDFDKPNAFWNRGFPGYERGDVFLSHFGRPFEKNSSEFDFGFQTFVSVAPEIEFDFNGDGMLDIADLESLRIAVATGDSHPQYDVNGDGVISTGDLVEIVTSPDHLNTYIGDSNLDGEFNTSDFVTTFRAGKYERGLPATWSEGDWNGDDVFSSKDLVHAFRDNGYEQGPRPNQVPEPAGGWMLACIALILSQTLGRYRNI